MASTTRRRVLDGECRACHDTKLPFRLNQKPVRWAANRSTICVSSKAIVNRPTPKKTGGVCHHVCARARKAEQAHYGRRGGKTPAPPVTAGRWFPPSLRPPCTKCVGAMKRIASPLVKPLTAPGGSQEAAEPKGAKAFRQVRAEAAAKAASIETAIVTSPTTCAGCHTEEASPGSSRLNPVSPPAVRGRPTPPCCCRQQRQASVGAPEARHEARDCSTQGAWGFRNFCRTYSPRP